MFWLIIVSNRRPRQQHDQREPILEVPESVLKTAACHEGHGEMGQVGAGLSGGEGELGKGEGSMRQKPER